MEKLRWHELFRKDETVILCIFPVFENYCSLSSLTQYDRSVTHVYAKCLNGFGQPLPDL